MKDPVELTLIGKPGCHLCDDAREAVAGVVTRLGAADDPVAVTVGERDILQEPELFDRYAEEIPVVLVGGEVHTYWRVDPARLETSIREAAQ